MSGYGDYTDAQLHALCERYAQQVQRCVLQAKEFGLPLRSLDDAETYALELEQVIDEITERRQRRMNEQRRAHLTGNDE